MSGLLDSDNEVDPPLPWNYLADLDSARRTLAAAPRISTFRDIANEYVRWGPVGGLHMTGILGDLKKLATEVGIAENEADDALAHAMKLAEQATTSPHASPRRGWQSRCVTAADLRERQYAPVTFIVPNLVPEGLTLLGGKPKVGKSWMALDICIAVASGRPCFGARSTPTGDVLYAALEDSERRLHRRIDKLMGANVWPPRLHLATSWDRLDEGGLDDINGWAQDAREPRLIVLDTLAAIRPVRSNPGYREDYEALSSIQRFANERGIAVLVLHHLRKLPADDPLDTVSGTLGLTGCADTILVLSRGANGTTIYCRGRDVEEAKLSAEFDVNTCTWQILGEAVDVRRSEQRQQILAAIGDEEMPVGNIVEATGMERGNLDKLLHSMVRDGEIKRVSRGVYRTAMDDEIG